MRFSAENKSSASSSNLVWLAMVALLAWGCGDDQQEGGCNTDADCPAPNERCIYGECKTVTVVCTGDSECPPGQSCQGGVCRADDNGGDDGCTKDADCPEGQVCDTSSGECVAESENGENGENGQNGENGEDTCTTHSDCDPPDTICGDGGTCEPGCVTAGCDHGEQCNTSTGLCEPEGGCTTDAQCNPPNTICEDNSCVPGCINAGCDHGEQCNTTTGRCEPAGGCTTDDDCPGSQICRQGECGGGYLDDCAHDPDFCAPGYVCEDRLEQNDTQVHLCLKPCAQARDCIDTYFYCRDFGSGIEYCFVNFCDEEDVLQPCDAQGTNDGTCIGVETTDDWAYACFAGGNAQAGADCDGDATYDEQHINCAQGHICAGTGDASACYPLCDTAWNDDDTVEPGCDAGETCSDLGGTPESTGICPL